MIIMIVKMREIFVAASAAGVACAFGSPIGGVIFSIEVSICLFLRNHLLNNVFLGNVSYI